MAFDGYRVTSNYGYRVDPITGKKGVFHAGIDLVKSHKASIGSFTAGSVVYAGPGRSGTGLGGYGNVVLIKDSNGRGLLYAHLDSAAVKTGAKVSKGQTIGYQGASGQVTGSHLHFEVRKACSPSYGWTNNAAQSTLDPTDYIHSLGGQVAAGVAQGTGKVLQLPKTSSSWRVYPTSKAPVKGNEKGFLNPKKFGGLEYDIIGNPQKDVYTIKTGDFGTVNIYAAASTGAKVVTRKSKGKKVTLPKSSSSWRVYPTNKAPVKGNEKGFLNPKKFGGLTYDVLATPQKDVVTIRTDDFGKVNIYVASSTGAVIK